MCSFSYCFFFYNFAFKELYYHTICLAPHLFSLSLPLSFIIKLRISLSSQVSDLKKMQQCFQYCIMNMSIILQVIKTV